jgi:hypothetical protein
MEAFLVDAAALRAAVDAASRVPLEPDQLRRWGQDLGEALEVVSFADSNFMLAADALTGLPEAVGALYGIQDLYGHAVNGTAIATGYMPAQAAQELLADWPEPDFDNPASEVMAAREELEGWLRRAVRAGKSLLVIWD